MAEAGGDPGVAFVAAFIVVAGTTIPSRPLADPLLALAVGCQDADSAPKQLRPTSVSRRLVLQQEAEDIILLFGEIRNYESHGVLCDVSKYGDFLAKLSPAAKKGSQGQWICSLCLHHCKYYGTAACQGVKRVSRASKTIKHKTKCQACRWFLGPQKTRRLEVQEARSKDSRKGLLTGLFGETIL